MLYGPLAGAIDEQHSGLRCRADPMCRFSAKVAPFDLATAAATERNAHELTHDGYVHVARLDTVWSFGNAVPRRRRPKLA